MIWKSYSPSQSNSHAFLAPSSHHWLNYSPEKLADRYTARQRTLLGTKYHELAGELIKLAVRLPDTPAAINSFVNDAIRYRMESEQFLFYSQHCYGTADAIAYSEGVLRIHDLKTGTGKAYIEQLHIYAALFCLDYQEQPEEIILRIYQGESIEEERPNYQDILHVMARIVDFSRMLDELEDALL